MANKCLVTRLKAAIQNDDLPLFDTIKLHSVSSTTNYEAAYRLKLSTANEGVVVKVNGNGYFATTFANLSDETKRMTETTMASSSIKYLYFAKGDYDVFIQNAHNIVTLGGEGSLPDNRNVFELDLAELKNNPGIVSLQSSQGSTYGDINNIPSTLTDVMVAATPTVTGNFNTVASRVVFSNRIWISVTGITGSIEGLVAGQVAQGATEGNLNVRGILGVLTFGGIIQRTSIIGERLEWNGNDRILVGCLTSSGINPPASMDAADVIYAKGATSSEISAWEQAGKTVVVITDDGE